MDDIRGWTRDEAIEISRELRAIQARLKVLRRHASDESTAAIRRDDYHQLRQIGQFEAALELSSDALSRAWISLEIQHDIQDEAELPEEQA